MDAVLTSIAMLNVIDPARDQTVVVVGVGAVGLSAIMALQTLEHPPKKIIAVDIVGARLELARSFGATHGVNSKVRPELMKVLMDITDGRGVNGAIDTTGRPQIIKELIHSAARKGKVVTVGVTDVSSISSTSGHGPNESSFLQMHHSTYLRWLTRDAATSVVIKEIAIPRNFFQSCCPHMRKDDSLTTSSSKHTRRKILNKLPTIYIAARLSRRCCCGTEGSPILNPRKLV